jgi:hypothetical protein
MKIVSREEVINKLNDIDNVVESILDEFNKRRDPDIFYVDIKLYMGMRSESHLHLVIIKLNEILKAYKYVASYDQIFWIKYVE